MSDNTTMKATTEMDDMPLSVADMKRMKRTPQAKTIRSALGFSQEEFTRRIQIPIGTLRD